MEMEWGNGGHGAAGCAGGEDPGFEPPPEGFATWVSTRSLDSLVSLTNCVPDVEWSRSLSALSSLETVPAPAGSPGDAPVPMEQTVARRDLAGAGERNMTVLTEPEPGAGQAAPWHFDRMGQGVEFPAWVFDEAGGLEDEELLCCFRGGASAQRGASMPRMTNKSADWMRACESFVEIRKGVIVQHSASRAARQHASQAVYNQTPQPPLDWVSVRFQWRGHKAKKVGRCGEVFGWRESQRSFFAGRGDERADGMMGEAGRAAEAQWEAHKSSFTNLTAALGSSQQHPAENVAFQPTGTFEPEYPGEACFTVAPAAPAAGPDWDQWVGFGSKGGTVFDDKSVHPPPLVVGSSKRRASTHEPLVNWPMGLSVGPVAARKPPVWTPPASLKRPCVNNQKSASLDTFLSPLAIRPRGDGYRLLQDPPAFL